MNRTRHFMLLAAGSIFASPLAYAQSPAGGESQASSTSLDEVVVTARKRSETLADVPISVTAFTEQSLERLNIRSFDDYATQTPNLSFSYGTGELSYGGTRTPAIRGISGEGTVGVYIDDTPVPDTIDPRVVDIARIDVGSTLEQVARNLDRAGTVERCLAIASPGVHQGGFKHDQLF